MDVYKKIEITHEISTSQTTNSMEKSQIQYLPVRELNPGLPRDRRGY